MYSLNFSVYHTLFCILSLTSKIIQTMTFIFSCNDWHHIYCIQLGTFTERQENPSSSKGIAALFYRMWQAVKMVGSYIRAEGVPKGEIQHLSLLMFQSRIPQDHLWNTADAGLHVLLAHIISKIRILWRLKKASLLWLPPVKRHQRHPMENETLNTINMLGENGLWSGVFDVFLHGKLQDVQDVDSTMWLETGGTLISILGTMYSFWATVLVCQMHEHKDPL